MARKLPVRLQGTISEWKDRQGFGFIIPDAGREKVFVHRSAFVHSKRLPAVGAKVIYDLATDPKHRLRADKVSLITEGVLAGKAQSAAAKPATGLGKSGWFAVFFLSFLAVTTSRGHLPAAILVWYLACSVLSFATYAIDKSAARKGLWRTRETTLHTFDLAGGWPGGLLAQRALHHKTRKGSFQVVFWLCVLINSGMLVWLFGPSGQTLLRRFF